MKGFDLSDTQDYYRRIIDKAMEQAASLGEIEQRQQYLDKYLPWVMMNDQYPTVLTTGGYNYWPVWARRSYASRALQYRRTGQPARSSSGGRTSFGDVAASFSGWAESTMGGMAAAIMPGSMNLPTTKGGFVDLSGVDKVTGDVFEALSKSSGKGGGGRSGGSSCALRRVCMCVCMCRWRKIMGEAQAACSDFNLRTPAGTAFASTSGMACPSTPATSAADSGSTPAACP